MKKLLFVLLAMGLVSASVKSQSFTINTVQERDL